MVARELFEDTELDILKVVNKEGAGIFLILSNKYYFNAENRIWVSED